MARPLAALALLLAAPAAAQDLPAIRIGIPYATAREQLLAQGWQPHRMPDADACAPADERCRGRPEMQACAGTGVAPCRFTWRLGTAIVAVTTGGEVRPTVTGVSLLTPAQQGPRPVKRTDLPGDWSFLDGVWTTGAPAACPFPNTIALTPNEIRFTDHRRRTVDVEQVIAFRADTLETVSASSAASPGGTRWRYTLLDQDTMRSLHLARGIGATWRRCPS